jgi:ribose-phosphate pyrophosphokinase
MPEGLLFSTSASPHLVTTILSQTPLRPAQYRLGSFVDGEIMIYLDEPVKGLVCFVLGHTSAPAENLLRMLTIVNTLKINGAKAVIPIIPYFGYSRSDKDRPLQPINARLFAGYLKQAGASEVICLNLHSKLVEEYFTVPLVHLSALSIFADYFLDLDIPNLAIATPDMGGTARAEELAKIMGTIDIINIRKSRPSDSTAEIRSVDGDVEGKNILIVDDMVETGHTLMEAAKALRQRGARKIFVAVTHCVYPAKGIEVITKTSLFTKVLISNSLVNHIKLPSNVSIIDIGPLFSKAVNSVLTR